MQEKCEVPSRKTLTNKIWIKKKYITTFVNVSGLRKLPYVFET